MVPPASLVAVLGIWLMAAPAVLGYGAPALSNDQIVGPLLATTGICAIWEVLRGLRWVNVAAGAWLLLAPWLLGYQEHTSQLNSVGCGALAVVLSLFPGKQSTRYGGGWRALFGNRLAKSPPRSDTA